jgi:hypothetical protein
MIQSKHGHIPVWLVRGNEQNTHPDLAKSFQAKGYGLAAVLLFLTSLSEFVALRCARDLIVAMRYKLRMFGIPINGPALVYCDNQGVVKNVMIPESVLSKKHNAIDYHVVREAVAANILRVAKESSVTNVADLLTKPLTEERRSKLLKAMLYNL